MNIFERLRASGRIQITDLAESQFGDLQTLNILKACTGGWGSLRNRLAGSGLLSTMLTVGSLTLLVKIVAGGKEVFVARQLGVGDSLDAFLVAFSLPGIAMNVISSSFNVALIPTYIQVRERDGDNKAQQLLSNVIFWSLCLLLAVSMILAYIFPLILPYFAPSFTPQKLALTCSLFEKLLPVVTITGVATTWAAVLNAHGEFALPAMTPIISSLIIMLGLLSQIELSTVQGLAIWTLTGACLEMILLGGYLWHKGIPILPKPSKVDDDLRQVMRQYAPLAAASLVFSGTNLADQTVAARLGSGSVSALSYGGKIIALVMGVSATAVSTSVLPHFSRLVAVGEWQKLRSALKLFTLLILGTLIPAAVLISYFSVPMVRLVFERGAFTQGNTQLVAYVQMCLAPQLPFYTLGLMYLRLTSALKKNERIFQVASASVVLNFILDIIFARHLGVAGIALSTSCVALVYCIILYCFLINVLPKPERK